MKRAAEKKVLIMAGGTGGHIFPALSIAEKLLEKGIVVEWLGTRKGLEAKIISKTEIPIHYISISGLRGKSFLKKLLSPFVIMLATIQSLFKLMTIKPSCVLGMGGFVTGPGGLAARILGKNLLIHEQNAIAGFSNQLLFPLATTVMEGFPNAFLRKQQMTRNKLLRSLYKDGKAIDVGNPVRAEILNSPRPEIRFSKENRQNRKLRLLVVGGSLGAVAINKLVPELLAQFPVEIRPEVLHQCGRKNLQATQREYQKFNIELDQQHRLEAFIDDMAAAYAWADIAICRSGALTVAEISNVGIPAVFIPYPYAVDDHQTENALILHDFGAAWIVQQADLKVSTLTKLISDFIDDENLLLKAGMQARKAARANAADLAASLCMEACHA